MTYQLVVVGGGPAGATAAVFAARAGLRTAVVDSGGTMLNRALVYNHFGLPDGTTGPEAFELGRRHAVKYGAEWLEDDVVSLSLAGSSTGDDLVTLTTATGRTLQARDVLLAQGTKTALAVDSGIATEPGREPWIATVITVDSEGRTSMPHVWAAGTVAGTSVHVVIVAGDGGRVAVNLISAQRGERHVDHDALELPAT